MSRVGAVFTNIAMPNMNGIALAKIISERWPHIGIVITSGAVPPELKFELPLVSCPIALYPATSESEKVRFNQLNKNTGNRIRYSKVDAETGDEMDSEDIVKGYQVSKGLGTVPQSAE
jgi:hypothetical protein